MRVAHYLPLVALLFVTGCTTSQVSPPEQQEQITTLTREQEGDNVVIHSNISGSSSIKNWRVLDNSNMVIETYQHGDLLATFMTPCSGIRFAETIGFSTMGPFDLDKFTKVFLPDGRWCQIKELKPYIKLDR